MFNFFNSPMLKSIRRTFRPPTLMTGGDGSPTPFPLPLPGGLPEPDAVFGVEPSTPPVAPPPIAPPEPLKFTTLPGDGVPPKPLPRPSFDTAAASMVPTNTQLPTSGIPSVTVPLGNAASRPQEAAAPSRVPSVTVPLGKTAEQTPRELRKAEGGAEALQKVTEGREAASKLLTDGKDAVRQRFSDGKDAVRQKEELIRQKREAATARDRQLVGDLRKQADQRKLEKAEERDRNETRKAVEGLGDTEFVASVDATLEDDLHRVHEMSGAEVRELRNRIQRARLAGMGDKASKALSTITSVRTEGLTEKNSEFFPTKALAKRLRHLEEGSLNPVLDGVTNGSLALDAVALAGKRLGKLGTFARVVAPHTEVPTLVAAGLDQASQATATKFRELLGERAKFGDEEAQQALDRSNRLRWRQY